MKQESEIAQNNNFRAWNSRNHISSRECVQVKRKIKQKAATETKREIQLTNRGKIVNIPCFQIGRRRHVDFRGTQEERFPFFYSIINELAEFGPPIC